MIPLLVGFLFLLFSPVFGVDLQNPDGTLMHTVWAHYAPWHNPLDTDFEVAAYYNYPVSPSSGSQAKDYRKEFELAKEQGIDGFFVDVIGLDGQEIAAYARSHLEPMLEAAEGMDFWIAPKLDGTPSPMWQIVQLTNLFNACSGYSNLPKIGNRYVVCTYTWYDRTPEEWIQIRDAMATLGYPLYLIANMGKGHDAIAPDLYDEYSGAYDMAYVFSHLSLPGEEEAVVEERLRDCAGENGADWMATVWPGYLGAWLNGRNAYYQPHFGFDQVLYYFDAIAALSPRWVTLSTWNDYDETPFRPTAFEFGGNAVINRYLLDHWRGNSLPSSAQTLFAYHREEMIGAVLRIESLILPGQTQNAVTVSGSLIGIDSEILCSLPAQVFTPTGSNSYLRNEWNIPIAELGAVPAVVPEITVTENGVSRTAKLPAIMLKTGWIQNQTTVKVPFDRMAGGDAFLSVEQDGNLLMADSQFDCSENVVQAELFRNDRPIGPLTVQPTENPLLFSQFEIIEGSGVVNTSVSNGVLAAAASRCTDVSSSVFNYTTNAFHVQVVAPWQWIRMQMEMDPAGSLKLDIGISETNVYTVDLLQMLDQHTVYFSDRSAMLLMNDFDNNVNDHSPLTPAQTGSLSLNLWSREKLENDTFYVRFTTESGKIFFSQIIAPFCEQQEPVELTVLQTMDSLESSGGNDALDRTGYLGKPPFATPETTNIAVHPASLLADQWTFDNGSWDSLGERPIRTAKRHEWIEATDYITSGGYDGGNCINFDGLAGVELGGRVWPLGPCSIEFFIKPMEYLSVTQDVITRGNLSSTFEFILRSDGRLEVSRSNGTETPDMLLSEEPLSLEEWSRIRLVYDGEQAELFVNETLSDSLSIPLELIYGNCTATLGGGNFTGMLDDLTIWSYPRPDFVCAEPLTITGTDYVDDTCLVTNSGAAWNPRTSNFGGAPYMAVGFAGNGKTTYNGLLRFADLSAASGQTVSTATLRLWVDGNWSGQTADATVSIYQVAAANSDWIEGSSNDAFESGASSWQKKLAGSADWAGGTAGCGVAGTDYTTDLVGSVTVTNNVGGWYDITLDASVVQNWIDTSSQNYGLLLTVDGAAAGQAVYIYSSESSSGNGAQLQLNLIPDPSTYGLFVTTN